MYGYIISSVMGFFHENLKAFQPYEVSASELIKKIYNVDIVSFCDDARYDFKDANGVSYEVKTEPSSLIYHNNFIEVFAYGKPSGLSITEANYYIFCNTTNYCMISVVTLRELVKLHGRFIKTKDKLSHGYLVSCSIIIEQSIELK